MKQSDGGGGKAEEAVRAFFNQSGYLAVRNIKLQINGEEITDLDLWAYGMGSPTHRARVVVDCKYKLKHAHVFERILWIEGLRRAAGVEHAVIATTDKREAASKLASRMQIRIIGPEMLDRLIVQSTPNQRFSEEAFLDAVIPKEDKLTGRFKERLQNSKSRLLKLDFDSVNLHIEDLSHYALESTRLQDGKAAIRLFYLSAAFLLVTLDFVLRDAPFHNEEHVRLRIDEGIRFGSRGRAGANVFLETIDRKKRADVMRAAALVRADILSEFFGRIAGTDCLLKMAQVFEVAAYHKSFTPVGQFAASAQSIVGIILDFLQIDRHILFGVA